MHLYVHDKRNWIQPKDETWLAGEPVAGIELYNDPNQIIFRKNDHHDRKDLVIKLDDDNNWIAVFFRDNKIIRTLEI